MGSLWAGAGSADGIEDYAAIASHGSQLGYSSTTCLHGRPGQQLHPLLFAVASLFVDLSKHPPRPILGLAHHTKRYRSSTRHTTELSPQRQRLLGIDNDALVAILQIHNQLAVRRAVFLRLQIPFRHVCHLAITLVEFTCQRVIENTDEIIQL